ncbi:MAG: NUDIX domain-containing protein [Deltaproteobacteria bacterium]|nr:NUDIX domain-containing protein [Deltaproteobacteria bacterium]
MPLDILTMDLSILHDREGFPKHVIDSLAKAPVDYLEQLAFIDKHKESKTPWEAGGVLLLLSSLEKGSWEGGASGEYAFLLNKRSKKVRQAGDLCAPGGGIHPYLDRVLQWLLSWGLIPLGKAGGLEPAKQRGEEINKKVLLFLANALRESWEEIRLSPFNVEFLGALPTYGLHSRRWFIFPVVGRVKRSWKPKLSWEVEKIVSIPLKTFYQPENLISFNPF